MVHYKSFLFDDTVDAVIVDNEYISFGGVGKEFYIPIYADYLYKDKMYVASKEAIMKVLTACQISLDVLDQNYKKAKDEEAYRNP